MFGIFKRRKPRLEWVNVFGQNVGIEHDDAVKVLKDFENEWPGGLDEIESSINHWRSKCMAAELALQNATANPEKSPGNAR